MILFNKIKLLEGCTKIGSGATPFGGDSSYKSQGISLIRSQNILDFTFSKDGLAYIDDVQAKKLANVAIKERDVLINITGDSVARVCQVPKDVLPARVNQHVSILRTNKELLNPEFLKYSLLSKRNKEILLSLASTGATRKALTKTMLEDFEIDAPEDVETQTRIASILSSLDDKIELNRRMNQTLEQMAQALFNYYFVDNIDPDNLPEGWRIGRFEELLSFTVDNRGKTPKLSKEGFPMIESWQLSCNTSFIDFSFIEKQKLVSEETYNSSFRSGHPKYLDIICALVGSGMPKWSFLPKGIKVCIAQNVVAFRVNTLKASPYFLKSLMNTHDFIDNFNSRIVTTAQPSIKLGPLKEIEITIPDKGTISHFDEKVRPLFDLIENKTKEVGYLMNIRDTLLPKLMSGEIDVEALMKEEKQPIANLETA